MKLSDKYEENLVSIVMPTYNRAEILPHAVRSVINQSFEKWELLIIDNESSDNTEELVKDFSLKDSRIKYVSVKKSSNPGISDYLNHGIQVSSGEFIARLDDDDEWHDPDKLKKQVDFLKNNKDYGIVGGGVIMIDGERKELFRFYKRETDKEIRNNALYANPFWHSTVLFRKILIKDIEPYRNLRFVEDWDLWLRLGQIGKLYNFKEHFSLYLNAGQNLSVSNQKLAAKTILKLIKKYRHIYPNFRKAYFLNSLQLLFSYTPSFFRKKVQNYLFYLKRNYF